MDPNPIQNDQTLIDLHLGQCDPRQAEDLRRRLQEDPQLAARSQNVRNALDALKLSVAPAPPDNLVSATMARIASARRTEALIAREETGRRWRRPTFSLRELTVAAAAVLVLGITLIPTIRQVQRHSDQVACMSNVGQIGSALSNYAAGNDSYLPTGIIAANLDGANAPWGGTRSGPKASNSAGLFRLVRAGNATPDIFQCPASDDRPFAVQAGMVDFPQRDAISYSYQYALGQHAVRRDAPVYRGLEQQMVVLGDSTPLFVDGQFRPENAAVQTSPNHDHTGQNVLHLDMHADWVRNAEVGVDKDNIFLAGNRRDYQGVEAPSGPLDTFLLPPYIGK